MAFLTQTRKTFVRGAIIAAAVTAAVFIAVANTRPLEWLEAGTYDARVRATATPGDRNIVIKHLLPNGIGPIIVAVTLGIPSAILAEATLAFIGIGVQPPLPTWGSLASEAVNELSPTKVYWWMLLYPCLLLVVTRRRAAAAVTTNEGSVLHAHIQG